MKSVHIALLLAAVQIAGAAEVRPPAGTEAKAILVKIFRPTTVSFRVTVYDPVLHLRYSELDSATAKPEWYEAFQRLQRFDKFEYADWIQHFSPDYVRRAGLNAQMLERDKISYNKDRSSSGLATVLWTVYADVGTRRFCFAIVHPTAHLDQAPLNATALPGGVFVHTFEFLDGRWKNHPFADTDAAYHLPHSNRTALDAIVRAGSGIVDQPNNARANPLVTPVKQP